MSENEIVNIVFSSESGERAFAQPFVLEIEKVNLIRLITEDIPVSIFIPYPNDFFDTDESEFLEYKLDVKDSVILPPVRLDLEPGSEKEYQAYDIARNHFAWQNFSSPPKIVIRG